MKLEKVFLKILKIFLLIWIFNTFGAVWKPLDYSASVGWFLGGFYPTAKLKIVSTCPVDLKFSGKIDFHK